MSSTDVTARVIEVSWPLRVGWSLNHSLLIVLVEAPFRAEAVVPAASVDATKIWTDTSTLPGVSVTRISVASGNCSLSAPHRSAVGKVSTVPSNVS